MRGQPVTRRLTRHVVMMMAVSSFACLTIIFTGALGVAVGKFSEFVLEPETAGKLAGGAEHTAFSAVLYETDFLRQLQSGKYFRSRGTSNQYTIKLEEDAASRPAKRLRAAPASSKGSGYGSKELYRTVCVRLCDGYYFPISTATTRDRFGEDEAACQRKCSSPARLFVYPIDDGSPETMVDLRRRKYSATQNAFTYRVKYNPSCQCRPDAWEPKAVKLHQLYATAGWQKRAQRLARLNAQKARRRARIAARKIGRSRSRTVAVRRVDQPANVSGVAAVDATAGVRAGRRRSVAQRSYSPPMALGVKPRSRTPAVRRKYRPRKRGWQSQVFGASHN